GEMTIIALLSRLVVVGADHEGRVGAVAARGPGQADRLAGAVRAGAGHDLDASGGSLADRSNDALVFLVVERRRLAGGADRRQAVGALLDVPVDETAEAIKVNVAVAEGGDERHRHAGELFSLGLHAILPR